MEINFAVRFNLIKCGYGGEDDAGILAKAYGIEEQEVNENLTCIEKMLETATSEIACHDEFLNLNGKKILFIGDSLTSDRLGFANILKKVLPAQVIDRAVSGSCSTGFVERLSYILKEHRPDIVHILLGTNDIAQVGEQCRRSIVTIDEYEKNIDYLLKSIKSFGAKVIISTIPYVYNPRCDEAFYPDKVFKNDIVDMYNEVVVSLAEKNEVTVNITAQNVIAEKSEELYEPDGIHLSFMAHKLMAKGILNILKEGAIFK